MSTTQAPRNGKWIKRQTVRLRDLPATTRRFTYAVHATSVTDALGILKIGKAISASGDTGSINVWRGSDNKFHCEFDRYLSPLSEESFSRIAAVAAWLKVWWPELQNPAAYRRP